MEQGSHVPARTGRKDADVRADMLDVLADGIDMVVNRRAFLQGDDW